MKANNDVKEQSPKELFQELQRREALLVQAPGKMRLAAAKMRFFQHPLFPADFQDCDKYRSLIGWLKDQKSTHARMFIFAMWAYQEDICQPEEILGEHFSEYEKAGLSGPRGSISIKRMCQALVVGNWVRYFQRLLRDRREGRDLRALGYDESAILAAVGKKRPVQAACNWLARKFSGTPANLANAYSWFYSGAKRSNPELFS